MSEKLRVGILTSGGDCQALNAAMRGVVLALYEKNKNIEIIGIENGYEGLINGNCRSLAKDDFENILALGGNGSQKTANLLSENGLNIVSLPKTIDNDVAETDLTFGYASALEVAARTIENIKTTAASHSRIFIVEIMGHKTGHLTLNAGMAGGADVILIPEMPYDIISVAEKIKRNELSGKRYSIVAVAEGAKMEELSVSFNLAFQLKMMCDKDVRVSIPGHVQRGGAPCPQDRILASRLGAAAAECILKEKYGVMVALKSDKIVPIELNKVAGVTKYVDVESDTVKQAKSLGICFG